jgi:hypothetical protein
MLLAEINMLRGPLDLAKVLGKSYGALTSMSAVALNLLLAGDSGMHKVTTRCRTQENHGLGKRARVCPECLVLGISQHPNFNFSLPIPCRLHQIMPIDECPRCDLPLSYVRKRVNYCDCGFKLIAAPRVTAPDWLPRFFARFLQWDKPMPLDINHSELAENFSRAGRVVRVLLTNYPNSWNTVSSLSWIKLRELLAMEKFIIDWAKSFEVFVETVENQATTSQRNAAFRVLRRYSGLPLKPVIRNMGTVIRRSYECDAKPASSGEGRNLSV